MSAKDPYASLPERLSESVKSLSDIAVEAIERLIAEGALEPGERINESHLATRLGISRGPIREACKTLAQAGLLEGFTHRGMYVRTLSAEDAQRLYELRAVLAGFAGRLIVREATEATLAALSSLQEQMDRAVAGSDAEEYFRLNLEFHEALITATGSPPLIDSYMRTVKQLLLTRRRGLVTAQNIAVSNGEHHRIMDALLARDAAAAEAAMRSHVENGFSRLLGTD
ncbi:GntR family transcriptional regulator [Salipiger sp. H15]|uniref:GntR family transcriptional regulator n=1 Tax=Alloyangia sp. H15 TaxID=3029062 RepID=UPI003364F5DB